MNFIRKIDQLSIFTLMTLLIICFLPQCYSQSTNEDQENLSHIMAANILEPIHWFWMNNLNHSKRDTAERTVLHWTVFLGNVDAARAVLQEGTCDVDATDRYGTTALHLASYTGHNDIVRLLVRYNASVNARDCQGYTPLHLALLHNHVDLNEFRARQTQLIDGAYVLRQKIPLPDSSQPPCQTNHSMDAWSHHPLACVYVLMQRISSWLGRTFKNCIDEHFEVVRYLLQQGAVLTSEDRTHFCQKFPTLNEEKERKAIATALEGLYQSTGFVRDLNRIISDFAVQDIDTLHSDASH